MTTEKPRAGWDFADGCVGWNLWGQFENEVCPVWAGPRKVPDAAAVCSVVSRSVLMFRYPLSGLQMWHCCKLGSVSELLNLAQRVGSGDFGGVSGSRSRRGGP